MSLIELKGVNKIYRNTGIEFQALNNVNLVINQGEMIALIGTSGSGKTTLLNIIGCIDNNIEGKYLLNGNEINIYRNDDISKIRNSLIGFVLQNYSLINKYTVEKNICIPLEYSENKFNKSEKKSLVDEVLKKVNMIEKKNMYAYQLSGGEKQRVAISRAIINKPKIILADEPTGALDSNNSNQIIAILKRLNANGTTVIIATHDNNIAKICNRVITMEDGCIISNLINE